MKKMLPSFTFFSLYLFSYSLSVYATSFCGTPNAAPMMSRLIAATDEDGKRLFWDEEKRQNLTYCISSRFSTHKGLMIEMMEEATKEWSEHANVRFIYLPDQDIFCHDKNTNVLFRVTMTNNRRSRFIARAFFPNASLKDRKIIFTKKILSGAKDRLRFITKHELGHVLGFRHEHIHPDNQAYCYENDRYDPLTPYDPYSVMHYLVCDGRSENPYLSTQDKLGAALAYP